MPIVVVNKERMRILVFVDNSVRFKGVEVIVVLSTLEENASSFFNSSIIAIKRLLTIGFSVSEVLDDHIAKECNK